MLQPCFCDDLSRAIFVGERSLRAASGGSLAPVYSLVYNGVRSCWRVVGHVTTPDPTTLPYPYSFAAGGPVAYQSCFDAPCLDSQDPCVVGSCVLPNVPTRMRSSLTDPDMFNGCAIRMVSIWEVTGTSVRILRGSDNMRDEFTFRISGHGVIRPTDRSLDLYESFYFKSERASVRIDNINPFGSWDLSEVFEAHSWAEYLDRVPSAGGVRIAPDPSGPSASSTSMECGANRLYRTLAVNAENTDLNWRLNLQLDIHDLIIGSPSGWGPFTFDGGSGTATLLPNGSRVDTRVRINDSFQFLNADFSIVHSVTMVPAGVDPDLFNIECPTTRKAVPCAGVTGPNIAVDMAGLEWVSGQAVKVSIDGSERCYQILNELPDDSLEVYSPIELFANCPACLEPSDEVVRLGFACDGTGDTWPYNLTEAEANNAQSFLAGQPERAYAVTPAASFEPSRPVNQWSTEPCQPIGTDRFRLATRCPNGRRPGNYPDTIRCPIETPVGTSLFILASGGGGLTCVIRYVATDQTTDDESLQIGTPTTRTACSGLDYCIDPDGGTGDQPSDLSELCFICTGPAQPPVCSVPAVQAYLQSNCGRRLPGSLTQTSTPRAKPCLPCQQRRDAGLEAALAAQRAASGCRGCGDAGGEALI